MRNRRGQAALEFLTTYGWAFLVILVMIGALAYFGVINPKRFIPESCTLSQELLCEDFQVVQSSAVGGLYLKNNLGETITLSNIYLVDSNDGTKKSDVCTPTTSATLASGSSEKFTCAKVPGTLMKGDKTKFKIELTYKKSSGQFDRPINGEMFVTIS